MDDDKATTTTTMPEPSREEIPPLPDETVEPLPESTRPRKDGPGGE